MGLRETDDQVTQLVAKRSSSLSSAALLVPTSLVRRPSGSLPVGNNQPHLVASFVSAIPSRCFMAQTRKTLSEAALNLRQNRV
jgi:hypothetical protein